MWYRGSTTEQPVHFSGPAYQFLTQACVAIAKLRASRPHKDFTSFYCAAVSEEYSVATFATLRVLSCFNSLGFSCSCYNRTRCCCVFEACSLMTGLNIVPNSLSSWQILWTYSFHGPTSVAWGGGAGRHLPDHRASGLTLVGFPLLFIRHILGYFLYLEEKTFFSFFDNYKALQTRITKSGLQNLAKVTCC
jgi:hypothetical protein